MKERTLSALALLLFTVALTPAAARAVPARHVPNEIIIKFHSKAATTVERQLQLRYSVSMLNLSRGLDRLSVKYGVRRIKPLLEDFRGRQRQLRSLREKTYELLTQKERRVLRKLKRAPTGAKVPNLDRIYKIEFGGESGQSLEEALEAYRSNPDVEYAELNYIVSVNSTPNDPLYPAQWSLSKIDAPGAWDVYTGSSQTVVAVVDTGADYNHRDLQDNMWVNGAELNGAEGVDDDENGYVDDVYGYNFIYNSGDPFDDYGHGTHVSGIIAAAGDNSLDITGVCWNAKIMALKFMGSLGKGSTSDAALAIYYAVANGADVISNSWGTTEESKLLKDAVDYAHSQGVIIVASAGNDGLDLPQYPAGYQHVISVAATDANDNKWSHSNYGDWVDVAAPGADILSLWPEGRSTDTSHSQYTSISSGTSMAGPHVAGACALLLSVNPLMKYDQVYSILTRTADPISPGICLSNGRVNLFEGMRAVIPSRGYVSLDHDYYTCAGSMGIFLADWDLKGKGGQEATIMTNQGDLERVTLTETSPTFGVFTGTISTESGEPRAEDGTVQVSAGDAITVIYFDANDGTGNPGAMTDGALTDCEVPRVLGTKVETKGRVANMTFVTNEPTTAQVRCGLAPGGPYTIEEKDPVIATDHTVKLQPLSVNTDYYFVIDLVDTVGNETIADNNGLGYSFTTPAEFFGFRVPSVYLTIQAAIDDASDGDTIWVADGRYIGQGNFDIDFKGKAITVRSENGPENCIIDCQRRGCGFDFHNGEGENSVLLGLTITNGFAGESGGGIRCTASSPTITNCIITENSAGESGGGMYNSYNSNPILTDCTFSKNSAESVFDTLGNGGGMCNMVSSNARLTNCAFSGNSADQRGAGMYNCENSSPILDDCTFTANLAKHGGGMYNCSNSMTSLTGCTFSENSAEYGGAIYNSDSDPIITRCTFRENNGGGMHNWRSSPRLINCTFSGNSAEGGGAMKSYEATPILINCTLIGNSAEVGGGIWNGRGSCSKLINCILWNNSDNNGMDESAQIDNTRASASSIVNYCCIQGWTGDLGGIGNLGTDPLFADPDAGDYHLRSVGWRWNSKRRQWHYDEITSPCIDTGNPGSPLNGELLSMPDDPSNMWGINLRINMGTYGGTAEASLPPYGWALLGDLTNDGIVNMKDFAAQVQYSAGTENEQPGDLNRSGRVNAADLALLAEDWLKYIKPPVVNIIYPQNDAVFVVQAIDIDIEADAWDANGSVVKVEFLVDGRKIGEDNDGSDGWKANWSEDARGAYSLTARATDNGGITTTSPPVEIRVMPPR